MNTPQPQHGGSPIVLVSQERSAPKPRTNLACVTCRSHHLRCDGGQPVCSRCKSDSKQCLYMKSRRGGLDKATLLKKRAEKAQMQAASVSSPSTSLSRQLNIPTRPSFYDAEVISTQGSSAHENTTHASYQRIHRSSRHGEQGSVPDISGAMIRLVQTSFPDEDPAQGPGNTSGYSEQLTGASNHHWDQNRVSEKQLELYYAFLHESHPFVLPRTFLKHYWDTQSNGMQHLMKVIQYCGSLYSEDIDSAPLKQHVIEEALQGNLPVNGFTVQAHILLSIALHCLDELEQARVVLDMAVRLALSIGMNLNHYAVENGRGTPVLEESWRRTWWSLYISDLLFTGIRGLNTFSLRTVHTSVDLPCAEESYASGKVPSPRSLAEYDSRHFADEAIVFSSFTYLIDSARVLALVFYVAHETGESFDRVVSNIDTKLVSWTLNLPKEKQQLVGDGGKVDELLFQAHVLINTATVHLHRPRSKLATSSLEASSRCAPLPGYGPSPESLKNAHDLHTAKTLVAAKAVITMFTLPTQLVTHSPLILCQLGFSSLAYMSACTFVLKGSFWQDAKDLVQVCIGAFKVYAELWPISARTLRQLKTTGREVFPLEKNISASHASDNLGSSSVVTSFAVHNAQSSAPSNGLNGDSAGGVYQDVQMDNPANGLDLSLNSATFDAIFELSETSDPSWRWNGS